MKKIIKSLAGDELHFILKPYPKDSRGRWYLDIGALKLDKKQILNTFKKSEINVPVYQTNGKNGFSFYGTITQVLNAIKNDNSIYKISFYSEDENRWNFETTIVSMFEENKEWIVESKAVRRKNIR